MALDVKFERHPVSYIFFDFVFNSKLSATISPTSVNPVVLHIGRAEDRIYPTFLVFHSPFGSWILNQSISFRLLLGVDGGEGDRITIIPKVSKELCIIE